MIEWKKSANKNNMTINELKIWFEKYPGSSKKILSICNNCNCNKERWINYYNYHDLCGSCARSQKSGKDASHWKGGKIELICDHCGSQIERYKWEIGTHVFCDKNVMVNGWQKI